MTRKQVNVALDRIVYDQLEVLARLDSIRSGQKVTTHDLIREAIRTHYRLDELELKLTEVEAGMHLTLKGAK